MIAEAINWFVTYIPEKHATAIATLVSGLFGFTGVIITLSVNAYLTRRADRVKAISERHILRVALRAELRNLVRVLSRERDFVKNNDFSWVPLLDFFAVYKENLDKLGLLSSNEVEAVSTSYYSYLEEAGYIVRMAKTDPAEQKDFQIGKNIPYDMQPGEKDEKRVNLIACLTAMIEPAVNAVNVIGWQLRLPKVAEHEISDGLSTS